VFVAVGTPVYRIVGVLPIMLLKRSLDWNVNAFYLGFYLPAGFIGYMEVADPGNW
jgi:hypothetical protein